MSTPVICALNCTLASQVGAERAKSLGYTYEAHIPSDTEWVHKVDNNTLCIGFNGSNSNLDWIYDFTCFPRWARLECTSDDTRCHTGFTCKYLYVRDKVHQVIDSYPGTNVIITGHSLGSAIATLCAFDVQFKYPNKYIAMYGFGVPKVGNKKFCQAFNECVKDAHVYIYANDFIESVPPKWFGYAYTTPITRLGQRSCWSLPSRADHNIANYERCLRQM